MSLFRNILLPFTLTLIALPTALGNGGGYTNGGVGHTGTIRGFEPIGTQHVQILDEQLDIALGQYEARVEVRYVLKSTGKNKVNVRFGFPVEELADIPMGGEKFAVTNLTYCRDYRVEIAGKSVEAAFQKEPAESAKEDVRFVGIRGWLVSKITFNPEEEKTMTIRYRADYPYSVSSVSEDVHSSARMFKYRLSTGAAWNGPIERGRIVIRAEGADPSEIKVLAPANRFQRNGNRWEWSFEKLKPTLADDLTVQAVAAEESYGDRLESGRYEFDPEGKRIDLVERNGIWSVVHGHYSIKASSTLPPNREHNYEAKNVADISGGVWSEGAPGVGIGEWLELTPEVARPLRSVRIRPGYGTRAMLLYDANARPKRIEVRLNNEHRFDAEIADRDEEQTIVVHGYDKPVKTVRLTILDAYRGKQYEDLCISSIRLETLAKKKPKIQPAR